MDQALLDLLFEEAIKINSKVGLHDDEWKTGDLSFLLHAGQRKIQRVFKESPHQVQVVLCARGFGKTYWGASAAVAQTIKKPRSRIKIATQYQTDLEEFIIPNFEEVLESCPEGAGPEWRPSKSRFVHENGSAINLIGLDRKPNGLRGQHNIDLIILEEAGFISKLEKIYRSVIVPITTHRPNCKIILISTPPESIDHYFWTFVDRAEDQGSLSTFTIDDNPMLTRDDIARIEEEMGGRSSDQFRREYLCERLMDSTMAILPEWAEVEGSIVVAPSPGLPPFYKPIVAIDLGLNDNCGVIFGYWDFNRAKVIIQAELLLNGVNSDELTKKCMEIEKRLWGDVTPMRWADGGLYTINDICSVHHYSVSPVKKDILEAQVNSLRLMLQARQIEIESTCKQTIRQCASGTWDSTKTKFARHGSNHQDLLAALIYLVRHINKENPYPRDYQYNRDTMLWRPSRNAPTHLESIRKAFTPKMR